MADPVPLIGPDGKPYTVDPSELDAALSKGFRPDSGALGAGKAAAEGAVSGATLGLSKVLGGSTEDQTAPSVGEVEARDAAEHPIAHGAGEIAGMLASPVNELAAPIEGAIGATTVAGRIGAKALSGAAVGSLFGAGNALSEAALGNTELNAEKLIAGAGLGGALGLIGGGIGGGLEEAVSPLAKKLDRLIGKAGETLDQKSVELALKAAGATKSDLMRMTPEQQEALGRALQEGGHIKWTGTARDVLSSLETGLADQAKAFGAESGIEPLATGKIGPTTSAKEAAPAFSAFRDQAGEKVGSFLQDLDKRRALPSYADILSDLDKFEGGLTDLEKKAIAGPLNETRETLYAMGQRPLSPGRTGTGFEALNALKSNLQAKSSYVVGEDSLLGSLKRQLAGTVRQSIDEQAGRWVSPQMAQDFQRAKKLAGLAIEADNATAKLADRNPEASIRDLLQDLAQGSPGSASDSFRQLADLHRISSKAVAGMAGNNTIPLTGWIAGAGALGGHGFGAGLLTAIGAKALKERLPSLMARAADALAKGIEKSELLSTVAEHFGQAVSKVQPGALGEFGPVLANALALSPAHALATHVALAQMYPDQYPQLAAKAGFPTETPEQTHAALVKASGFNAVKGLLDEHDQDVDRLSDKAATGTDKPKPASAVLRTQDFGAKRMRREAENGFEQRTQEISRLAANPSELASRVAANVGPLARLAPATTAAVSATASRAVSFLQSKLPKLPPQGPLAPSWKASSSEIATFSRYLEAVQHPHSVLRHAAHGTLTPESVEALRAVYPQLYGHIQSRLMDRIAGSSPESIPYRQRLQLAMLTGSDLDGTQRPEVVAAAQAVHARPSVQPSQAPAASPAKGLEKLSIASRVRTPFQRSAAEEEA